MIGRRTHRVAHALVVLTGGSGAVLAWMVYAAEPSDPFAVMNHPWQGQTLALHVFASPWLAVVLGAYLWVHAWPYFLGPVREGRATGIGLLAGMVPMIATGYLIQVAKDPSWRTIWGVGHTVVSGLWLAGFIAHAAVHILQRRRRLAGRGQVAAES